VIAPAKKAFGLALQRLSARRDRRQLAEQFHEDLRVSNLVDEAVFA
jgi:hypothetical protein